MTDLRRIFALYDRAYRLLGDVTPRRFNCGTLCGAACCHNLSKSGDTETGMLLLPFEKDYLQHAGATGYSYLCDSNREEPDMLICSRLCVADSGRLPAVFFRVMRHFLKLKTEKPHFASDRIRAQRKYVRLLRTALFAVLCRGLSAM